MRGAILSQIAARQRRVAELTAIFNARPAADPERSGVHLIEVQHRTQRQLIDRLTTWPEADEK